MRSWRKEAVRSAGGTSWRLIAGRGNDRARINLSRVSEDDAEEARLNMQSEEDAGRGARVLKLYADNPEAAVRALLGIGHAPIEAMLPAATVDYKRLTVREYFDGHYKAHRAADRPATWRTEQGHWRRLLEGLGDVRMPSRDRHGNPVGLEPRVFLRWVRDLKVEKSGGVRRGTARSDAATVPDHARTKPASGAYQRLLRAALQAMLTYAYTEGHLDELVMLGAGGALRIRGSTRPAKARPVPLNLEECAALLKASTGKHRAMWGVGIGVGLRPSELQRLRWEHARWSTGTMLVPGTKTEAAADEIAMTPIARRELEAWWKACGEPTEGWMFESGNLDDQDRPLPYEGESGYKRSLATSARRAGIARTVTPYLLRASFVTVAWSLGIEKDVTQRIGRWTDQAMIDEVYCRPRPADLVARVKAFDWAA